MNEGQPEVQPLEWADDSTEQAEEKSDESDEQSAALGLPEASTEGAPQWVKIPKGMKFPRGAPVVFIQFRAHLTASPSKGDRQAILWPLSDGDEKAAYQRAMSDPNRAPGQLAKQMVRSIDGHEVDWSGSPDHPGNIDRFWNEIGGRYRTQLIRLYTKLHILNEEEQRDFFENCVAVRTAG